MQTGFKVGDRVRVRSASEATSVGVVERIDAGYVHVRYEHRPGVVTLGLYPAGHLEAGPPEDSRPTKTKATTADILSPPPKAQKV